MDSLTFQWNATHRQIWISATISHAFETAVCRLTTGRTTLWEACRPLLETFQQKDAMHEECLKYWKAAQDQGLLEESKSDSVLCLSCREISVENKKTNSKFKKSESTLNIWRSNNWDLILKNLHGCKNNKEWRVKRSVNC